MLDANLPERLVEKGDKLALDALEYIEGMWQASNSIASALELRERELRAARERIIELNRQIETLKERPPNESPFIAHARPLSILRWSVLGSPGRW